MLRSHLQYASYVARHKWFVLVAGLKTRAPLWRLLIHDWSKLTPAEWTPYVDSFYREIDPATARVLGVARADRLKAERSARFDAAWLHHQHRNPHHWQHWQQWLLCEDDEATKVLPMPEPIVREMVADWMGAGRAITGKWDVSGWYNANAHKIVLADDTRQLVQRLVSTVGTSRE